MAVCPGCLGDGVHDCRDEDAVIAETWEPERIEAAKAAGMIYPVGIVTCQECEGTGVVTEERAKDLYAAATAMVDQIRAKFDDEERGGTR